MFGLVMEGWKEIKWFSTLEATIKAVKEFNAEIIVGIDNTFLSPYILVC